MRDGFLTVYFAADEVAVPDVRGQKHPKRAEHVNGQSSRMSRAFQFFYDCELPGNMGLAERNMALRFHKMPMRYLRVHRRSLSHGEPPRH